MKKLVCMGLLLFAVMMLTGCQKKSDTFEGRIEGLTDQGLLVGCSEEVNRGAHAAEDVGHICRVELTDDTIIQDKNGDPLTVKQLWMDSTVQIVINEPLRFRDYVNDKERQPLIAEEITLMNDEPLAEGFIGYLTKMDGDRILVVSSEPEELGSNRGLSDYYAAVWFTIDDPPQPLQAGMKVKVQFDQLRDSYAEHMDIYLHQKPKGAALDEDEAIRKAIATFELPEEQFAIVTNTAYNAESSIWLVSLLSADRKNPITIEVKDE
ncbi:DUF3221 domain-containing protein [Paenibacillus sp. PL2-23]|uniref:DUF3221 domain-containing protein n=1 Tax=Paenibacillus sp. PL2-23 TaxID=2100729 RepID=UPI0030FD0A35